MRDQQGITVSIADPKGECGGSLDGLQAMAREAKAEAILGGRVFSDDRSGVIVRPHIFLAGADKRVDLSVVSVPRGTESTLDIPEARQLAATVAALVGSSKRSELLKAIGNGTELSFYLDLAKEHLTSSPPDYDAAEALLRLATWKAPTDPQAYRLLAASLTERRQYTEAGMILESGIRQASGGKAALYVALAENAVRARRLPEARQVYAKAIADKVLSEEAWLGIARTHLAARPPERSLAMEYALKATSAQSQTAAEAYTLAGQIALATNDLGKAEKYFQEGTKVAPNSPELVSRLSSLYERLATEESAKGNPAAAIKYLTEAIKVSPSVGRLYDRGGEYLKLHKNSEDRSKGYELASADFMAALNMARRESGILAQFPWLMPGVVEALIFEGRFQEAKKVAADLFATLASDATIRPSANPKEIRLVATFLNAAAEMLDAGAADKEFYLFENARLGMEGARVPWSFAYLGEYLAQDYPKTKPELSPSERETRVATVRQWMSRLGGK